MACGILVLDQGSNPHPLQWKWGILTTGPPRKSHSCLFLCHICSSHFPWLKLSGPQTLLLSSGAWFPFHLFLAYLQQDWDHSIFKGPYYSTATIHWPTSFQFSFLLLPAMAPHSSPLAWKIPWMEEPGGLQSMGSLRIGHDWATSLSLFTFMHWRRKRQPTPLFLPGESQGRGSLVGCCLWGRTESDTTEVT